jgi:hypothetical protein
MKPMPLRPAWFLLALLLAAPPPAAALRLVVTGSVTEPGGRPVPGARVVLEGAPGASALTDAAGRYALAPTLAGPTAAAPLRLVLRAAHRGWNLALPSGAPALVLELRRAGSGDTTRTEVRSSDAAVAKAVATALAAGAEVPVELEARFTRRLGREDRSTPEPTALSLVVPPTVKAAVAPDSTPPAPPAPPERPESLRLFPSAPEPVSPPVATPVTDPAREETVATRPAATAAIALAPATAALPAPIAPAPAVAVAPAAIALADSGTTGPPTTESAAADTTVRPGLRVSVRPESRPAASVALRVVLGRAVDEPAPAPDGCDCRVGGTVEVRSERPVRGEPRVLVALADRPAARDTVTIFMGPPRPFDLGRVPCGRHELRVTPLGGRRLALVAPDSTAFGCGAGDVRQIRIVLEPR